MSFWKGWKESRTRIETRNEGPEIENSNFFPNLRSIEILLYLNLKKKIMAFKFKFVHHLICDCLS